MYYWFCIYLYKHKNEEHLLLVFKNIYCCFVGPPFPTFLQITVFFVIDVFIYLIDQHLFAEIIGVA